MVRINKQLIITTENVKPLYIDLGTILCPGLGQQNTDCFVGHKTKIKQLYMCISFKFAPITVSMFHVTTLCCIKM